jgi:hypothetical protein
MQITTRAESTPKISTEPMSFALPSQMNHTILLHPFLVLSTFPPGPDAKIMFDIKKYKAGLPGRKAARK